MILLAASRALAAPVDLNTATAEELDALPLMGPIRSALWIEWRTERGGCTAVDDLRDLPGFGLATVEALRTTAVCGSHPDAAPGAAALEVAASLRPITVDINGAGLDQLRMLPGLPPDLAPAIVEYRELHGPFESCDTLVRVPGIGPATVAAMGTLCVAL